MTTQTRATQNILDNLQSALVGTQCPAIMLNNILNAAQKMVSEEGYAFDTALAIACRMYSATQHAARYAYEG